MTDHVDARDLLQGLVGQTIFTIAQKGVSDLRHPARLHIESLGLSWSEAESDHHAFLYWSRTGLVVIPFEQRAVGYRVGRAAGSTGVAASTTKRGSWVGPRAYAAR